MSRIKSGIQFGWFKKKWLKPWYKIWAILHITKSFILSFLRFVWSHQLWQAVLAFIHFQDMSYWYQQCHFLLSRIELLISTIDLLISVIVFSLVKCHHRLWHMASRYRLLFKMNCWYQELIFFTSRNIIFDINNYIVVKMWIPDINN